MAAPQNWMMEAIDTIRNPAMQDQAVRVLEPVLPTYSIERIDADNWFVGLPEDPLPTLYSFHTDEY